MSELLSGGFTRTHMTGRVRPKAAWLSRMREGRFGCHSTDGESVALDPTTW
ncbi:hypothetical protein [Streptomyces lancefieldiae]|uniref:Uncharacterized protein n=1 Tax=Streptomyces lancefieldiae TaxID=3075520 RepID=A0ABU3AW23_9ACTN|nr:hypothetical protein [Streptomyces sp. DSM 40712]MDT0614118.1 hypothetical protein [Streptomyces sp. DSM 40712]